MKENEMKTPCHIIVAQGVPASGKSTWAREYVLKNESYVIVSRDNIRRSRGKYFISSQEKYISKLEVAGITEALNCNLNVIIDATNLNPKTIQKWEDLAKEKGAVLTYRKFEVGFNEALERDSKREFPVGKAVISRFFKLYKKDLYDNDVLKSDDRFILAQGEKLPKCIICDIDGTVALMNQRNPYSHLGMENDKPNLNVINIVKMFKSQNIEVIFFSGREGNEEVLSKTNKWIKDNVNIEYKLFTRKNKDQRKDSVVKYELYLEHIKDKFNVVSVFDDRDQVVKMWREIGLLCCQVYYGDF